MSDEDRHPTEDVELTVSANGAAGTASAESTDDQPTGRPQVELPSQPEASLPSPVAVRDKDKERDSRKDSKDKDRERDSKDKNRERDSSSRRSEKEKDKDRDSSRRKDSRRSRSRDRHSKRRSKSRSASRDRRSKRRSKSRSKSRDRRRSHRSPSRDGGSDRRSKRVSRSRSPDRGRGGSRSKPRASRSRSPRKSTSRGGGSRRSRSSSEEAGGYVPRRRDGSLPASAPAPAAALNPALALPRPLGLLPGNAFQVPPNMATVIAGHATNTDPYAHLRQAAMPTDPNAAARLWQEQQLHARQVVLQQQAAAAAAAATKTQREARRLYVGNLGGAGRVTDMALRQLFNAALMPAFPSSQMPGMEPVVNVSMHSEGRYCFVELRNAEMATAAMQLSGQVQLPGLSGPLTVERPSGYVDPTRAQQAATAAAQALAAFQAGDTAAMTAAATLSASLTGMPNAAAGMPGVPGSLPDLPGLPGGLGMALPGPPALPGGFPGGLPGPPPLPAAAAAPLAALPPPVAPPADALSSEPTAYLCVTGVVTASVLKDDRDYDDVKDELLDECGRHAPSGVVEVKVPRPPNPSSVDAVFGTGHYGRAFVHFADAEGAGKARDAIHGRLFAGITVQAVYITQAAYQGVEA